MSDDRGQSQPRCARCEGPNPNETSKIEQDGEKDETLVDCGPELGPFHARCLRCSAPECGKRLHGPFDALGFGAEPFCQVHDPWEHRRRLVRPVQSYEKLMSSTHEAASLFSTVSVGRVSGKVDEARFREALAVLQEHHQSLRLGIDSPQRRQWLDSQPRSKRPAKSSGSKRADAKAQSPTELGFACDDPHELSDATAFAASQEAAKDLIESGWGSEDESDEEETRVDIGNVPREQYFVEFDPPTTKSLIRCTVVARKSDDDYQAVRDAIINRPFFRVINRGLLWRVVLLLGDDRSDILVATCHSINDGTSRLNFLRDLLTAYATGAMPNNRAPLAAVRNFDDKDSELQHFRSRQRYKGRLTPNLVAIASELGKPMAPLAAHVPIEARLDEAYDLSFDAKTVKGLRAACKAHGVTVNSGIVGCLASSFGHAVKLADGFELGTAIPISLRPFAGDEISPDHIACCVAVVEGHATWNAAAAGPWDWAKNAQALVHADRLAGAAKSISFWSTYWAIASRFSNLYLKDQKQCGRMAYPVAVSNLGWLPNHPRTYGDLRLDGFFAAQGQRVLGGHLFAMAMTCGDNEDDALMCISLEWTTPLVSAAVGKQIAQELEQWVRSVAAEASAETSTEA
jgi:hypothetical protein